MTRAELLERDYAQRRAARGDVDAVTIGRRHLSRGTLFRVSGESGEFAFSSARVVDGRCLWVNCHAARKGHPAHARSFTPERITRVRRAS